MKTIIFIFNTVEQSKYYFSNKILPCIVDKIEIKKPDVYETKNIRFLFKSYRNPDNIRGLRADTVYLCTNVKCSVYNSIIKQISDNIVLIDID